MLALYGCGRDGENAPPAGGDATRGKALLHRYGCNACHEISGVRDATGNVGPPLDGVGERVYLAGTLPNSPQNMVLWIRAPQQVRPGTAMPDLGVSEQDATDMAAYLRRLR